MPTSGSSTSPAFPTASPAKSSPHAYLPAGRRSPSCSSASTKSWSTIEDTDQVENEDPLKRVVTTHGSYLCRKVIIACGLLHYPRKLAVLDQLELEERALQDSQDRRLRRTGAWRSSAAAIRRSTPRSWCSTARGLVDLIVREADADRQGRQLARDPQTPAAAFTPRPKSQRRCASPASRFD